MEQQGMGKNVLFSACINNMTAAKWVWCWVLIGSHEATEVVGTANPGRAEG